MQSVRLKLPVTKQTKLKVSSVNYMVLMLYFDPQEECAKCLFSIIATTLC